jgi:hypothetical protein
MFEIGDFVEVHDASHSYCNVFGTISHLNKDGTIEIQEYDCGIYFTANVEQLQLKL